MSKSRNIADLLDSNGDVKSSSLDNVASDIDGLTDGYNVGNSVGLGTDALANDDGTSNENTAVGDGALYNNTSGASNTAVGMSSMFNNTTGYNNSANGYYALSYNTTGYSNIGIGWGAGYAITTGYNNTVIGYLAGTSTMADTVLIGAGATERLKVTSAGLFVNGSSTALTGITSAQAAAITANTAKVSNVDHPLVETAVPAGAVFTDTNTDTTYTVGDGGLTQINFTTADNTKLDGIATGANNYSHPANHSISVITGLQSALNNKVDDSQVLTNVPSGALFTDTNTVYTHPTNHAISVITGLQDALDDKVDDTQVLTNVPSGAVFTDTNTETTTSISHNGSTRVLSYVDEVGTTTNIDLAQYIDDTNLARLVNGSLAASGIATFTRDDSTTFTIDMSDLLDTDTNTWRTITDSTSTTSSTVGASATAVKAAYDRSWPDTNTTYSVGDGGLTTNDFTDADHTKLNGIATSANNYSLPSSVIHQTELSSSVSSTSTTVAANSAAVKAAYDRSWPNTTYSVGDGGLTTNDFTNADHTKLNGIAASANNYSLPSSVIHQTELSSSVSSTSTTIAANLAGVKAAYDRSWPNTTYSVGDGGLTANNFTDADHTKLNGIAVGATANVGDITGVTAGTGLTGGGTSGTPTLNVIGGSGITANANDIAVDSTVSRNTANFDNTQRIRFSANATNNWDTIATSSGSQGSLEVYNTGGGNDAFMSFHAGGDYAGYFGLDADTNDLAWGGWSVGAVKHKMWHAGNDGSGSGLDADLLDGVQGASYLRSDTADTFSYLSGTQITLGTGVKLKESSHRSDLLLIEGQTGTWAGIQIDNTAAETIWNIMADGTTCGLYDDTSNQWSWQANDGGGINLNYNGAQKIVTTNTGVSVTGNIGVSGTVDGRDIATDGTKLNTIETGATADQSAAQIKAHLVNGIDSTHYVDGSIDRVHLAADVIDSTKLANDSVNSEHYVSNSIDALHLNVSGNGTTSQYLRSDGDGTMSWVTPPDTNTDTNTTYSADGNYGMTLSGTAFRLENDRRRNSTTTDVYSGNTHDYTFYDASHGIRWYTAGAEEMRLENDGDLHVDGSVTAYSATVSDERLKTDIVTLENAVDKIKQIRGVEFTRIKDGKRSAGVIAQELEVVLPQAITEKALPFEADTETLYKTVDYDQIHGLLIEAIKEQQVQIDELKEMIKCQ
ncbi:tail fiber domain-containing protein [Oceanospirillaceae bacterium]|nr:tail fiber domain-containing protein [Oceanospirillaceae bacterium]